MTVGTILKSLTAFVGMSASQVDPTSSQIAAFGFAIALACWGVAQVMKGYSEIIRAKKGRK